MLKVGLTGGIGSGKSTVARMFQEEGCPTLDLDAVAREVTNPGEPALQAVVGAFGPEILHPDGTLDRARLAQTVFEDDEARKLLEAILHPAIRSRWMSWVEQQAQLPEPPRAVMPEIPLLFEVGLEDSVDRIVLVTAHPATRTLRLTRERGMSENQARSRMASQLPDTVKRQRSHYIIENDSDLPTLQTRVHEVWTSLLRESESP